MVINGINFYLLLIKNSFLKAWKGEEKLSIVIWIWGVFSFFICYFLINPILVINKIYFIDLLISAAVIFYYIWHIIASKRCGPQKPKLSKEEKKKLKEQRRKDRWKRLARKLMLKEPMFDWNPVAVMIAADLYVIVCFLEYIID